MPIVTVQITREGTSPGREAASAEEKAAIIKGMTGVVTNVMKLPASTARKSFVQIFETAEGGFGVSGQVFAPQAK